jgi:glucosamine-6-phosphate deaminase
MKITIHQTAEELARTAAATGADLIAEAINARGEANIIVATGASQIGMLAHLVKADLDWSKVTAFHLDEYIGLPLEHPASFRKYLKERFVDRVPLKQFHYVDGEGDPPEAECRRVGTILREHPVDVAFIGIGENGHLAFNDPPADFEIRDPYLVVSLDLVCRTQQFKEGWFRSLEEVPATAISMSVRQIMESRSLICTVPGKQKAGAVRCALEGPVTPECPASILQEHPDVSTFLDGDSSSLIRRDNR